MARREWKLHTAPKLLILTDGMRIIVEDTEILLAHSFSNDDPHSFNGDRLRLVIRRYAEDQLHKVPRLE
jgi:hypothetical protein